MYKTPVDNWHMMGGIEHPEEDRVVDQEDDRSYFYQKWYKLLKNKSRRIFDCRNYFTSCIYLFVEL